MANLENQKRMMIERLIGKVERLNPKRDIEICMTKTYDQVKDSYYEYVNYAHNDEKVRCIINNLLAK